MQAGNHLGQPSDCANDPLPLILWCRIGHPALLHKLNTAYDKR